MWTGLGIAAGFLSIHPWVKWPVVSTSANTTSHTYMHVCDQSGCSQWCDTSLLINLCHSMYISWLTYGVSWLTHTGLRRDRAQGRARASGAASKRNVTTFLIGEWRCKAPGNIIRPNPDTPHATCAHHAVTCDWHPHVPCCCAAPPAIGSQLLLTACQMALQRSLTAVITC